MNKFNFDYSEYSDILHIHKSGNITKGSVEIGDFSLDFDNKENIIGIEIEHASEFFDNLDIDKESLNTIKSAEIIVDSRNPSCRLIFLRLEFPSTIKKISLPIPIVS